MTHEPLNKWDAMIQASDENTGIPEMTTYRLLRAKEVFGRLSLAAQEELLGLEPPVTMQHNEVIG